MKAKDVCERFRKDYTFRSFISSSFSLLATVVFLLYNIALGVLYGSLWNYSISAYYLMLVIMRAVILINEKRWASLKGEQLSANKLRLFKSGCYALLALNAVLAIPVSLMVLSQRSVHYGTIPAIATAAYTTYKVIFAIISYGKAKNGSNCSLRGLKNIGLMDAAVSVLLLQNTLISAFGEGDSMISLTSYTSAGILTAMIAFAVFQLYLVYRRPGMPG